MPAFELVLRHSQTGAELLRRRFDLAAGGHVVFGRAADSDVVIPDVERRVSSRHGRIQCSADGSFTAIDLGSLNGTLLRGSALPTDRGTAIGDGDVLVVGDYELALHQVQPEANATPDREAEPHAWIDDDAFAGSLGDGLLEAYERNFDAGATQRQAALRAAAAAVLDPLAPEAAAAVARRTATRIGGSAWTEPVAATRGATRAPAAERAPAADAASAPATAPTPAATSGPVDEIATAALAALRALAERLLGDRELHDGGDVARFADLLGQVGEVSLAWLARSLQGRGAFGQDFGAEVTLVFQRSTNPLKAMSQAELQSYLLDWKETTDIETRRYYLEGVLKDLDEHVVGVLAGVREAVVGVLQKLAPASVEALAENSPGMTKAARAWRTYQQLHTELMEERSKLYNEMIFPLIQRGYLQQHGTDREDGADGSD